MSATEYGLLVLWPALFAVKRHCWEFDTHLFITRCLPVTMYWGTVGNVGGYLTLAGTMPYFINQKIFDGCLLLIYGYIFSRSFIVFLRGRYDLENMQQAGSQVFRVSLCVTR